MFRSDISKDLYFHESSCFYFTLKEIQIKAEDLLVLGMTFTSLCLQNEKMDTALFMEQHKCICCAQTVIVATSEAADGTRFMNEVVY